MIFHTEFFKPGLDLFGLKIIYKGPPHKSVVAQSHLPASSLTYVTYINSESTKPTKGYILKCPGEIKG